MRKGPIYHVLLLCFPFHEIYFHDNSSFMLASLLLYVFRNNITTLAISHGVKNMTLVGTGILLANYVGAVLLAVYMPQVSPLFLPHLLPSNSNSTIKIPLAALDPCPSIVFVFM